MFKLHIRTDNAAFEGQEAEAVAELLRAIANALEAGTTGAPIMDENGNKCGRFDLYGPNFTEPKPRVR